MSAQKKDETPAPARPAPDWLRYRIVFYAHCGMAIPIGEELTKEQAQAKVKGLNRRRRREGFDVYRLEGNRWEHVDEAALMVGDDQGVLSVERQGRRVECRWCGVHFWTRKPARGGERLCCTKSCERAYFNL